jgi:hypothetical protein
MRHLLTVGKRHMSGLSPPRARTSTDRIVDREH